MESLKLSRRELGSLRAEVLQDPELLDASLPLVVNLRVGDGPVLPCPTMELFAVTGEFFRGLLLETCGSSQVSPYFSKRQRVTLVKQRAVSRNESETHEEEQRIHGSILGKRFRRDDDTTSSSSQTSSASEAEVQSSAHLEALTLPEENVTQRALAVVHSLLVSYEADIGDDSLLIMELLATSRWLGFGMLEETLVDHLTSKATSCGGAVDVFIFAQSEPGLDTVARIASNFICNFWPHLHAEQKSLLSIDAGSLENLLVRWRSASSLRGDKLFPPFLDIMQSACSKEIKSLFPSERLDVTRQNAATVLLYTLNTRLATADAATMFLLKNVDQLVKEEWKVMEHGFTSNHWSYIVAKINQSHASERAKLFELDSSNSLGHYDPRYGAYGRGQLLKLIGRWALHHTSSMETTVVEQVVCALDLTSIPLDVLRIVVRLLMGRVEKLGVQQNLGMDFLLGQLNALVSSGVTGTDASQSHSTETPM